MTFAETVARLEAALQAELPGAAGQGRMAPVPRRNWPKGFNVARVRHAAALLLVFPGTDSATDSLHAPACIVLTVRGETPRHPGQFSAETVTVRKPAMMSGSQRVVFMSASRA